MSSAFVSLLFTIGASTWLYTKLQRYSGNNTKQSLIATGVSAVVLFILAFYIFHLVLH